MTESLTTIPEKPGANSLARIGWAVLILATLYVCYFSHLGAIGFVGPDEPRYAWIARDMAETGDWVTPRLYGKPWFEKPPLYYWGAAACFKLFGVSETAARLPSAISALLATLALAWLAWRLYGAETARWLLLLLPTTVGMIGFSHAAATDMPFSGMLTIAMVCAAVVLRLVPAGAGGAIPASANSSTAWVALVLFGFFLGLAVLAKGPAGIILCGGAVFFWAIFTKRWRDAFRLLHPAAFIAFFATALPWYILCARRNPDFFRIFIIEHNFKRYLTPEFQHIQPFWFYFPVLLAAFLPWTAALLWNLFSSSLRLRRLDQLSPATSFFLIWAGFCIAFFTISRSKLPGYVLPAVPAIGLLVARGLTSRMHKTDLSLRWICLMIGLTLIAVGMVTHRLEMKLPFVTDFVPASTPGWFAAWTIIAGIVVGILGFFRPRRFALGLVAMVLPVFMVLGTDKLWQLDAGVSARPAAMSALVHLTEADLEKATDYKLKRGLAFGLNFYLRREIKEWTPTDPQHSVIFTSLAYSKELEKLGAQCQSYIAYPAVTICEATKGEPSLMGGATGGRELK